MNCLMIITSRKTKIAHPAGNWDDMVETIPALVCHSVVFWRSMIAYSIATGKPDKEVWQLSIIIFVAETSRDSNKPIVIKNISYNRNEEQFLLWKINVTLSAKGDHTIRTIQCFSLKQTHGLPR